VLCVREPACGARPGRLTSSSGLTGMCRRGRLLLGLVPGSDSRNPWRHGAGPRAGSSPGGGGPYWAAGARARPPSVTPAREI
jgi:hypothetical protein